MKEFAKVSILQMVFIGVVVAALVFPTSAQQERSQKPIPQDEEPIKLQTVMVRA